VGCEQLLPVSWPPPWLPRTNFKSARGAQTPHLQPPSPAVACRCWYACWRGPGAWRSLRDSRRARSRPSHQVPATAGGVQRFQAPLPRLNRSVISHQSSAGTPRNLTLLCLFLALCPALACNKNTIARPNNARNASLSRSAFAQTGIRHLLTSLSIISLPSHARCPLGTPLAKHKYCGQRLLFNHALAQILAVVGGHP